MVATASCLPRSSAPAIGAKAIEVLRPSSRAARHPRSSGLSQVTHCLARELPSRKQLMARSARASRSGAKVQASPPHGTSVIRWLTHLSSGLPIQWIAKRHCAVLGAILAACTGSQPSSVCLGDCAGQGGAGGGGGAASDCPLRNNNEMEVVDMSVVGGLVAVVTASGDVLCWGDDQTQQCGKSYFLKPARSAAQPCVRRVELGFPMTVGLRWDDTAAMWGIERHHAAGDGEAPGPEFGASITLDLPGRVRDVASGLPNVALLEDGSLYVWGDVPISPANGEWVQFPSPEPLPTPAPVRQVGEGGRCFSTTTSEAFCFGSNSLGILGMDDPDAGSLAPVKIGVADVQKVSEGPYHACALRVNGEVWCWGTNYFGAIGVAYPEVKWSPQPQQVQGIPPAVEVFAGETGSCALDAQGRAWCWSADPGTFGVEALPPVIWRNDLRFRKIGLGSVFACGLVEDGRVWCEGFEQGLCAGCFMTLPTAEDEP